MTQATDATPTDTDERNHRLHQTLAAVWSNRPGWGQLAAVNHSTLGYRFIITGFVFLLLGGMLSMFIRLQLAWPGNEVLGPERYNQFVTMHGTTMMFLFAVPVMEGFALYLVPKMIGARDVPFPRLTAFGYWCYLFGGIFLYAGLLLGVAPDGGWFMYVPLSGPDYTPGISADFWLLGVTFAEVAAVSAAAELIVSILKTRAPGMSIQRMPLFVWYVLITAFMIAFGFPPLILGSVLLEIERAFDFAFYDVARGGDPLLWQHLFWLFGHPEVYIIFLPAAGVVSMIIPTFSRRPMVGYAWVVLAVIGTGFISFGLWVHHMFAVGIPLLALSFFSGASMMVAIPMGIQIFAWIATLWTGRPVLRVPMLFLLGFFFVFVLGGLTGIMVALVPFDWQVHDSHFVVAHLHYVTIGGLLFPLLAGMYYWLPHVSGRLPARPMSHMTFWLIFIGFNVTFLPMHLTGLLGMPRRVYTYAPGLGLEWLNLLSTVGGFVLAVGIIAFVMDFSLHLFLGHRTHRNPWDAGSLEWSMPAPPPPYNFISIPEITGRNPLWEQDGLPQAMNRGEYYLARPREGRRETLVTTVLDARPEQVMLLSQNTWIPLVAALTTGLFFLGFLIKVYLLAALGALLTLGVLVVWLWTTGERQAPNALEAGRGLTLPVQHAAERGPGWWGTLITVLADASLFSSLVFAYFYLWLTTPDWPPPGHEHGLWLPLVAVGLLSASYPLIHLARWANRRASAWGMRLSLALAWLLGLAFGVLQVGVLWDYGIPPQAHAYASLVHTLTGFQLLHLLIALVMGAFVLARSGYGYVGRQRPHELNVIALFWNYTVLQGLIVFGVVHLFPLVS